jgi:hypothetical protein
MEAAINLHSRRRFSDVCLWQACFVAPVPSIVPLIQKMDRGLNDLGRQKIYGKYSLADLCLMFLSVIVSMLYYLLRSGVLFRSIVIFLWC